MQKKRRMRPKRTMQGEIVEVEVEGGRIIRALARKDRHSKVCTAKGPKDRRVRLSADTAIRFYDVQDRLCYDRPSLAIDWLMNEAKPAIDALPAMKSSPPSTIGVSQNFHQESQQLEEYYNVQNQQQNESEFQTSLNSFFNNYPESLNSRNTSLFAINSAHLDFEGPREMVQFQRMVAWDLNPGSSKGKELAQGFDIDSSFPWHLGDFSDKKYDFLTQREPLKSSYLPSTQASIPAPDTSFSIGLANNELLGFSFPTFTQGQEEEQENLVPKELSAASSVLHYQD